MQLVTEVIASLREIAANLPPDFYDTFGYTVTKKNYTHSITLGALSRIVQKITAAEHIAIDCHLNLGKAKFQPDLVALSAVELLRPILFLDYESPNSSDARIPRKDITAYHEWSAAFGKRLPYFIVTTLPDKAAADWELRYTSAGKCNEEYRGKKESVCQNPYRFWYGEYWKALS